MEYQDYWTGKAGADLISTESKGQLITDLDSFRPIYYLGCKSSFVSAIKAAIDEVAPSGGRLVDLFSGTGAVASAIGTTRSVTAVDVQEYSRVICSATLQPAVFAPSLIDTISVDLSSGELTTQLSRCMQPLIDYEQKSIDSALKGDLQALIELLETPPLIAYEAADGATYSGSPLGMAIQETMDRLKMDGLSQSPKTTVSRNFGGVYFSFQQAVILDVALSIAENAEDGLKDTLKAAALSTASSLVNTVGKQFAQPIQPRNRAGVIKSGLARRVFADRSLNAVHTYKKWLTKYRGLPRASGSPIALRLDYLKALEGNGADFSVVYADPPYTRDHYSRFYHVLETMCLRDNPTVSKVMRHGRSTISRGVYREDRHQSPFCIRSTAPAAFESLFSTARKYDLPLVLSYSPHETGDGTHPRSVSMEQLLDLANKYYKRVEVCAVEGVTHNNLNRGGLKLKRREHAEVILKCFCNN